MKFKFEKIPETSEGKRVLARITVSADDLEIVVPTFSEQINKNIKIRAHYSEIFLFNEWADGYIPYHANQLIIKNDVLKNVQGYNAEFLANITSNDFKKKVRIWCKINDYILEDRIMKDVTQPNQTKKITEHIRFTKVQQEESIEDDDRSR